jgi:mannose/fructose-specific phosphotransferase system component IIA
VKDSEKVSVLSGVNLYMLVTAFNHRKSLPLGELAEKVMAAGKKSIADLKAMFLAKK